MQTAPIPWNVLSSHVAVGVLTEGWSLDVAGTAGEEWRSFQVEVNFATAFTSVPVVQLGLTGFDIDQRDSARISLKATLITETGFVAEVCTWSGTRVYGVAFDWLAIGA